MLNVKALKPSLADLVIVVVAALGFCALAFLPGCSAPEVRTDAVRDLVQVMDERVDAYVAADESLADIEREQLLTYGDGAVALVAPEGAKVGAEELRILVAPLWGIETQYTLADADLVPDNKAVFLRNGLLVLTICTRAEGLPDPVAPVIPGVGILEAPEVDE